MARSVQIVNTTRGTILATQASIASTAWTRARGLLGRRTFPAGEGLIITPCNSIHCFFMAFPIDVVYVDREYRVLRAIAGLRPNRVGPIIMGARHVIELPEGTLEASSTHVGDQLATETL